MSAQAALRAAQPAPVSASIFPEPAPIALELMTHCPPRHVVHAIQDNRHAPLIRKGEIVVIEGGERAGWWPVDGGLFLWESESPPMYGALYGTRSRDVVQVFLNTRGQWMIGGMARNRRVDGIYYMSDGPYRDEEHLASKLIGKVVGLLAPYAVQGRA
jgi:hypothetical protein